MIAFEEAPVDKPWILWDPNNCPQLVRTCVEFDYARLQIATYALEGYYVTPTNDYTKQYPINRYGVLENYPDGLFDASEKLAPQIIAAAIRTRDRERTESEDYYE